MYIKELIRSIVYPEVELSSRSQAWRMVLAHRKVEKLRDDLFAYRHPLIHDLVKSKQRGQPTIWLVHQLVQLSFASRIQEPLL